MDDCGQIIQLPSIGVNTDRTISGVCTICLCPYEDGDQISWSTEESCQHAFHTDCIIPWLAKKEEPRCPVCRQEFCATPNVSHVDDTAFDFDLERENSFLQSFSQALAMSQLYRPYPSESANSYEQTRNAITLQLATLALENQVRLEQQTAAPPSMVIAPVTLNGGSNVVISTFPRRNSSRTVGNGTSTDLATTPSSAESPRPMNGDTTNENTINSGDVPPAPQ
jgi:Ring finger domain